MNLSLSLLKYCIIILVSAYLGARYAPDSKPPEQPKVEQAQKAACTIVVKKIVQPDGTVSESTEIAASADQAQKVEPSSQKVELNHSAILLKDQLGYSYKYIKFDMLEISPLIQVRADKSFHGGIQINF